MDTLLQLSATRWVHVAHIALVDYDPELDQWRVHLWGYPAPIALAPDEGAALAYYVQHHANPEAYHHVQRRRDADG
jgi:hypothetical protein